MQIDVTKTKEVEVAEMAESNEQKTEERRWTPTTPRYVWEDKNYFSSDRD